MSQEHVFIIVHRGGQDYLGHCLRQLRHTNPNARVVLLGDDSNQGVAADCGAEFARISDYMKSAGEFAKIYIHDSVNKPDYELFCFQRWFIIKDFITANGISRFVHLDSDVLVYSDLSDESEFLSGMDFGLPMLCVPNFLFISDRKIIYDFCDFTTAAYADDEGRLKWRGFPGISDMSAWLAFAGVGGYSARDLLSGPVQCNSNVNCYDNTETRYMCISARNANLLVYVWFDGTAPFTFDVSEMRPVRNICLHFQGESKEFMNLYATYDKSGGYGLPLGLNGRQEMFIKDKVNRRNSGKKRRGLFWSWIFSGIFHGRMP